MTEKEIHLSPKQVRLVNEIIDFLELMISGTEPYGKYGTFPEMKYELFVLRDIDLCGYYYDKERKYLNSAREKYIRYIKNNTIKP